MGIVNKSMKATVDSPSPFAEAIAAAPYFYRWALLKMTSKIRKYTKQLIVLAFAWLLISFLLLLQLWPDLPQTKKQWFLFIAFGPPIYAFGEVFFGWLFSEKHGRLISHRQFSVARIILALFVVLIAFILSAWVSTCLLGS